MPIRVRYKNEPGQECTIRPTPLVSIGSELNKTAAGDILGVTYSITLTGTLLPDEGTPYALDPQGAGYVFLDQHNVSLCGPYNQFDNNRSHFQNNRPSKQAVPHDQLAHAILIKQRALRELFANHGQRMEITDVRYDSGGIVIFPRINSISFSEGTYVDKCEYTIELEADLLYSTAGGGYADGDGMRNQSDPLGNTRLYLHDQEFVDQYGNAFISDFSESWSLEVDESQGEVYNLNDDTIERSYRITHNISATGKDHYSPDRAGNKTVRLQAWTSAKKFVQARLSYFPDNPNDVPDFFGNIDHSAIYQGYPNQTGVYSAATNNIGHPLPNFLGKIGAGTIDLIEDYGGYNHTRTENIDETAGSYSVSETWILSRQAAYETYNMSITNSVGDPFTKISINGNIKGLSKLQANSTTYGGKNNTLRNFSDPDMDYKIGLQQVNGGEQPTPIAYTKYESALQYYNNISNNQFFGVGSLIFKRANNQTQVQLNSEPLTISLGSNKNAGEITYSLEFDNRPTNIISNVASEQITVNDTYPGDVYSVVPVIGRSTGPVLQYIGGRTEYKRDVSINLIMDNTKIPYDSGRPALLLTKPSVNEPTATELAALLDSLSPANEPGVRKYFINAPSETWEPKAGSYSFNVSFVYELDK
tara:strand:- start:10747 stop:12684 length:1938 start_codon:yes stop_codon:yes gene_type:complete